MDDRVDDNRNENGDAAADSARSAGKDAAGSRAAGSGATEPPVMTDVPVCDLCGAIMLERHCKLVCTQCGYQRDCSDP